MYLTGFADEAAKGLDGHIKATKELGWNAIEARNIDGKNLNDIPDDAFEAAVEKLQEAEVKVNCFGSTIANWGKQINEPFDSSLEETKRAIPRMKKLGTKLIRIMSFAVLKDQGPDDQMEEERFKRVGELQKMLSDEGLTPVHENCMNYGGMGWPYTLKLIENVPGLKLVFDTGNPCFTADRTSTEDPQPKQSAWEFYDHVKEHVAYIHIKDAVIDEEGKTVFTHAGEGNGDVKRIVKDMLDNGYDGGISMEPHLAAVFHDESVTAPEEIKYKNYVEYGQRFMKLLAEIGHADKLKDVRL